MCHIRVRNLFKKAALGVRQREVLEHRQAVRAQVT
jgi:hypothetical protein